MRVGMLLDRDGWARDGRVRREMRALATAGHDVTLLHRGTTDADPGTAEDGGRALSVLPRRGRSRFQRIPWPVRRVLLAGAFAWRAARLRPEVVHAHDLPMLPAAWAAARLAGAALVYDSHEYQRGVVYHGTVARALARILERLLVPRCDAVIVVAEPIAALMHEHYGVDAVVVRNVPERMTPRSPVADLRRELGIGDEPLLLAQGAIAPARGAEELLEALAVLDRGHAVFLGDADPGWHERIMARASALGVGRRAHHVPAVAQDVLLDHTRQADLGLVLVDPRWASYRLAMPNKLFEYIAAGVPVVASAGTAAAAMVEELGTGWAAPFGDATGLAAVLARAVAQRGDPALRERLAAATAQLGWDEERERLLELYRGLALSRTARRRSGAAVSRSPSRSP